MENAISLHRWYIENCNRDQLQVSYLNEVCRHFNESKRYDYTIEVLDVCMDVLDKFEEEEQEECLFGLVKAYIGVDEFRD